MGGVIIQMDSSCSMLIKRIHLVLEKNSNNILRSQDLTLSQMEALWVISNTTKKQVSLKELEKLLHIAQSTTVGIVSRLEQKGLVESFGDNSDKRIKLVKITKLGEQVCNKAKQSMKQTEDNLLSGLTEIEKDIFKSLLQKVKNTLK